MFDLAWHARRGLNINLTEVPDHILDRMVAWTEEYIERDNAAGNIPLQ